MSAALEPSIDAQPGPATSVALRIPLSGSHLIEASAGSGKTWTLAALFVRLVIEGDFNVDEVLTVTFTRAATAELRQRIRHRLRELQEALAGGPSDALIDHLLQLDRQRVTQRCRLALAALDGAPIYTIHAFAQRALSDRAFSAAEPFDMELGDTRKVWLQAVNDFWRNHIATWDAGDGLSELTHQAFVNRLMAFDRPKRWADWLLKVRGARHAHLEHTALSIAIDIEQIHRAHADAGALWRSHRNQIEALFLTHPGLKRTSYRKDLVPKWCAELDLYFSGAALAFEPKGFLYFTAQGMNARRASPQAALPSHVMIDALEDLRTLMLDYELSFMSWRQRLLLQLFETTPDLVARQLSQLRLLGFDDLLIRLSAVLSGPRGKDMARALRGRYPAALIDEYQDTDVLQDRIFAAIYSDSPISPVFLVGDPKQAIYGFRGADIYTYLSAAGRVGARHQLLQNHRSTPPLIAALNAVYGANQDPFSHRAIQYALMSPAVRDRHALSDALDADPMPLRFIVADPELKISKDIISGPPRVADVEQFAAETTANEIARMLNQAHAQHLLIGARPLLASDMAVLVTNNAQGRLVRLALKKRGIDAADRSRATVFASHEAEWLLLIMLALAEPHRAARIKNALATPVFGYSASQLVQISDDESGWQEILYRLARYRGLWLRYGVMRLLRTLLTELPGAQGFAASEQGERHLTNLFHLAELLHEAPESRASLSAQCAWLAAQREADSGSEDAELRLESDQNLVQVLTIHKSKGLEFPVVFVPFLYAGKAAPKAEPAKPKEMPLSYHDPDHEDRLVIDFGGIHYDRAKLLHHAEKMAEDARLLYVALTRAIYRCIVFLGPSKEAALGPLGRLLGIAAQSWGIDILTLRDKLERAVAMGQVGLFEAQSAQLSHRAASEPVLGLRARVLTEPVPSAWYLSSFSALHQRQLQLVANERNERPDHDQDAKSSAPGAEAPAEELAFRFRFPRGAAAGECLHTIFERLRFDQPVAAQRGVITQSLMEHGFADRLAPGLASWLQQVVSTPLRPDGFSLDALLAHEQIREMEFHLPMVSADVARLAPLAERFGLVVGALPQGAIEGFLKGFIDLIVCHHKRFYVLDYKSNWLGPRFEDYRAKSLQRAMDEGGYTLQYLLYCLALVRWLRVRHRDFDYERDFGGVYYLFVRGMHPETRGEAPDGVYFQRPARALIDAIDDLFSGAAA